MNNMIKLEKKWHDDEVVELRVTVSDDSSVFSCNVYTSNAQILDISDNLGRFSRQIYGGLYDVNLGGSGIEYAYGCLQARFHFHDRRLWVSTYQESEHRDYKGIKVASNCKMYLTFEPCQLDEFIKEMRSMGKEILDYACMGCA